MLNRETLARDPATFVLADGGVAKVSFPPDPSDLPVLQEQLSMFVCEGTYAQALQRIVEAFNAVAGSSADTPAAWISGFYGSGKSLLAGMLGALWTDLRFPDQSTAEGLIQPLPTELRAALLELRNIAKRHRADLVVGGATLGRGANDPVKAIFGVMMRAAGLPATADLRPMLFALWLAEQGVLDEVRAALGAAFPGALEAFLLDETLARAALAAKPAIAPDGDTLMDRLNSQFAVEPEPTTDLLMDKARQALTLGRRDIPLTLILLDEVQQFLREDPNRALTVQTIAEGLASRFKGRVLLVCTGQSALGDIPYLEKLLGRFPLRFPLGSADINSVIRKTVLRKKPAARAPLQAMLDARSGEIDRHLHGSVLKRTAAERQEAAADWPLLATRRKLWERVMQELDRSGLGDTLRSQLRFTLDAVRAYAGREVGVAVPGDFLLDNFGAEALSRQLIGREFFDKVETLRAEPADGPLKARIMLIVFMLARIAGEAETHGVRATKDTIADLLVEDLTDATALRAKVPGLLDALKAEGHLIDTGAEWRISSKESAEWQAAFHKARAEVAADTNAVARHRAELLSGVLEQALSTAGSVPHGVSKTPRRIERVNGSGTASGNGLVLRLWNEWEHETSVLDQITAADVTRETDLHLFVQVHRAPDLIDAIVELKTVPLVLQRQGVPATEGGKDARTAMQARLERAKALASEILAAAVAKGKVLIAGGAEIGAGEARAEAVQEAARLALDRLYPQFGMADHVAWGRVGDKAKQRNPDAIKEVGHQGEPQEHPVCQALLRACRSGKRGSELRTLFQAPPYGWPREAIDAGLRVLALPGQIKVTGADHRPVTDLAALNDTQLGTCTFVAENRPPSVKERLVVQALGREAGVGVEKNREVLQVHAIVDALERLAAAAGGESPAPHPPVVPGLAAFRMASGNDLLAELAARAAELLALIPQWKEAAALIAKRLPDWRLATALIALGADGLAAESEAMRANRSLLADDNPAASLVGSAASVLRDAANAAHGEWRDAWDAGEARLKADESWSRIDEAARRTLRETHRLLPLAAPDVSTPASIADSLAARGLQQWRDAAAAHPARVEEALRDAAVELEPKTQIVPIPRRTLRTDTELEDWLSGLRAAIAPLLPAGPVLPTA